MCRTTAVINNFRTCTKETTAITLEDHTTDEDDGDSSVQFIDKPSSKPSATLKQSVADNAANRNSNVVQEKTFDIELDEPLHDMRKDTKLVIVDIPGINEAGTSSKYRDYVNNRWHTFDVAVVVMDGRQGVNTEEQLDLLKLVKNNVESVKQVPIIILCNKVDDPDNAEQRSLLKEARGAVENLFEVDDREMALQQLLDRASSSEKETSVESLLPAVIPISAMHGFLYRCGAKLSFDDFCKMDKDFIENIGKESYGRQWKGYTDKKKLEKAFDAVSDEEQRKDGLLASNIDSFVKVLATCIGDKEQQGAIIHQQVEVALDRMAKVQDDNIDLGAELVSAHTKLTLLELPTNHLRSAFWEAYKKLADEALSTFDLTFYPRVFARPLGQLASYLSALGEIHVDNEEVDKICNAVKGLVLKYAVKVMESEEQLAKCPRDFGLILGSMLLPSHHAMFAMHLGTLKLELDLRYAEAKKNATTNMSTCGKCHSPATFDNGGKTFFCCGMTWVEAGVTHCPLCSSGLSTSKRSAEGCDILHCSGVSTYGSPRRNGFGSPAQHTFYKAVPMSLVSPLKVENDRLVPADEVEHKKLVSVAIPESLEDPNHYGYPLWRCCSLLQAAAEKK